jgi:hypothetical protein
VAGILGPAGSATSTQFMQHLFFNEYPLSSHDYSNMHVPCRGVSTYGGRFLCSAVDRDALCLGFGPSYGASLLVLCTTLALHPCTRKGFVWTPILTVLLSIDSCLACCPLAVNPMTLPIYPKVCTTMPPTHISAPLSTAGPCPIELTHARNWCDSKDDTHG